MGKMFISSLILSVLAMAPSAFAGKVELTTYYPAPNGEYASLNASKSFIPPRMATADRPTAASIPPAVQGMVIFNTDNDKKRLEVYDGTDWVPAGGSPDVRVGICSYNQTTYSVNNTTGAATEVCSVDIPEGTWLISASFQNATTSVNPSDSRWSIRAGATDIYGKMTSSGPDASNILCSLPTGEFWGSISGSVSYVATGSNPTAIKLLFGTTVNGGSVYIRGATLSAIRVQ